MNMEKNAARFFIIKKLAQDLDFKNFLKICKIFDFWMGYELEALQMRQGDRPYISNETERKYLEQQNVLNAVIEIKILEQYAVRANKSENEIMLERLC